MAKTNQNPVDTEQVLTDTVHKLNDCLESIELHLDGEHGSTVADVARISTALVTACAELRQAVKTRRRQLAQYSLDEIVAYLKTLSDTKRDDVVRELTGSDNEEPLL